MNFYRATLKDADKLYDLIDDVEDRVHCINRLKVPQIYCFLSVSGDTLLIYEPAYGHIKWMTGHCYTTKAGRGKKLKNLFWETGIWIFENTDTEVITGVVPPRLRRYGLFLALIGATRQYEFNGTVMYTYDKTQVPEFKRRLKESQYKLGLAAS